MSSLQQLILETLQGRVLTENKKKVTIDKDTLFVFVDGDVDLRDNNLTKIPVKFGVVGGNFSCSYNQLTSLEGAPQTLGGDFYCSRNNLTSLEGSPQTVSGDFDCSRNNLTSLEGAPKTVDVSFFCEYQKSGVKFTEDDVESVSNVKGRIYV
jgi:hypothetical protein